MLVQMTTQKGKEQIRWSSWCGSFLFKSLLFLHLLDGASGHKRRRRSCCFNAFLFQTAATKTDDIQLRRTLDVRSHTPHSSVLSLISLLLISLVSVPSGSRDSRRLDVPDSLRHVRRLRRQKAAVPSSRRFDLLQTFNRNAAFSFPMISIQSRKTYDLFKLRM